MARVHRDLTIGESLPQVLTGNIHARIRPGTPWDPAHEPMGFVVAHLAPKLAIAALDVAYTGGTAWICETPQPASCGAKSIKGRPEARDHRVTVFAGPNADGYLGTYSVGALTASRPAVARTLPTATEPAAPPPARNPRH